MLDVPATIEALLDIETRADNILLDLRNGGRPSMEVLIAETVVHQATLASILRHLVGGEGQAQAD